MRFNVVVRKMFPLELSPQHANHPRPTRCAERTLILHLEIVRLREPIAKHN